MQKNRYHNNVECAPMILSKVGCPSAKFLKNFSVNRQFKFLKKLSRKEFVAVRRKVVGLAK